MIPLTLGFLDNYTFNVAKYTYTGCNKIKKVTCYFCLEMDRKTKILLSALDSKDSNRIHLLKIPNYEGKGTDQFERDLAIQGE